MAKIEGEKVYESFIVAVFSSKGADVCGGREVGDVIACLCLCRCIATFCDGGGDFNVLKLVNTTRYDYHTCSVRFAA